MKYIALTLVLLLSLIVGLPAHAVPATINIIPTTLSEDGSGGAVDGYRLYRGCNVANQTVGSLVADPAVVGQSYSFVGDTDQGYNVCAVAFNAAGEGGFDNIVVLAFQNVIVPPGRATVVLDCLVEPDGVIADCVQTN